MRSYMKVAGRELHNFADCSNCNSAHYMELHTQAGSNCSLVFDKELHIEADCKNRMEFGKGLR